MCWLGEELERWGGWVESGDGAGAGDGAGGASGIVILRRARRRRVVLGVSMLLEKGMKV